MGRPKLLIVSSRLPKLDGKADSITVYKYIEFFCRHFDITLISFKKKNEEQSAELELFCKKIFFIEWSLATVFPRLVFQALIKLNTPFQTLLFSFLPKFLSTSTAFQLEYDVAYYHLIRTTFLGNTLKQEYIS